MRGLGPVPGYRAVLSVAVLLAPLGSATAQGTTHRLPLAPENIHWGYYDAALEPAVRIRSGDRVFFESLLARGLERLRLAGFDEGRFLPDMIAVEEAETVRIGAHPLNGPIYVEGARPGDVLEVRILDVGFLVPYGVSGFLPGGGTLPDDFPSGALRRFEIDTIAATATMQGVDGVVIPLRPFFGSIGVAPPRLSGRIDSRAPGAHVGNLDNKELVEGTTLFLPVHVEGGLLSIGDGHAAQGDGEVSGTAIEASLYGTIEIVLHRDRTLWAAQRHTLHRHLFGVQTKRVGGFAYRQLDPRVAAVVRLVRVDPQRHELERGDDLRSQPDALAGCGRQRRQQHDDCRGDGDDTRFG